jgi:hypothetical protein
MLDTFSSLDERDIELDDPSPVDGFLTLKARGPIKFQMMRQFIQHLVRVLSIWAVIDVTSTSSAANPAFRVAHEYELPTTIYAHTVPWLSGLDNLGEAHAIITIEDVSLRYWVAWRLDPGPSSQIPVFTPTEVTDGGVFFGNWFNGPISPGIGVSIDAAIATESAGIQVLPRVPDQEAVFLRAGSSDGKWVGGTLYTHEPSIGGVVYGPDRVPILTGPFLPTALTANGTAYGIDTDTGMAAQWTLKGGMKVLPTPPIDAVESNAFHATENGLVHARVTNPFGSEQRYTHLLFDGQRYEILPNTADGITSVQDMNEMGWLVGYDGTNSTAIAWIDGYLYDLSDLVPNLGNVKLSYAFAVNDIGQITVAGFDAAYNPVAYLLTPIPEPCLALIFCVAGTAHYRRQ